MKTVLNFSNPRNRENKLFLGEPIGICNFADMKYPIFKKLFDEQWGFFWRPTEVSCTNDAMDIRNMDETERFIFESNLQFQTMGDSFLGQGIGGVIEHVTNNELKQCLGVHATFEEHIHTPSYSHIFESIYNNPSETFYGILENEKILSRARESTEAFDKLLNNPDGDIRRDIINTLVGLLALESVAFYNSFLTSYFFAKQGKMTGTGKIIKLINRDEYLHKANTINILKILKKEKSEGFLDLKDEIDEKIIAAFTQVTNQEIAWTDYLFSKGEKTGLTQKGMVRYLKFLANQGMKEVGLKHEIFEKTENPFTWLSSFQGSSKATQVAPQEAEITSYVKASKNDVDSMTFDF